MLEIVWIRGPELHFLVYLAETATSHSRLPVAV